MKDEEKLRDTLRDKLSAGDTAISNFIGFFIKTAKLEDDHSNLCRRMFDQTNLLATSTGIERLWTPFLDVCKRDAEQRSMKAQIIMTQIVAPLENFRNKRNADIERLLSEIMATEAAAALALTRSRDGVEKLKAVYRDRGQKLNQLNQNKESSLPKSLKLQKELTVAEMEYRQAVWKREEERLKWSDKRNALIQSIANIENLRHLYIAEIAKVFADLERQNAQQSGKTSQLYEGSTQSIVANVEVERAAYLNFLGDMWQDYPPVFYWHVSEGESKDLVFGVPLDVHLKATGRPVPYVLQKCIRAIESRGLKKEGIYRISAKHSDIIELRQKLEKDIAKVNLDDDVIDVHVICGVVKMFLRELPKPLLEIPDIERKEYVKKSPEDRVRSIQFFLKNENRATLKYLIYHLATVAQFCEDNKMTPQNLAVVFGPPILTNTQKDKDWSSGDTKTKAQQFLDKMQQSFLPESQKASSPSGMSPASSATELNLELAKNDIIIEELMREREIIFPSEKSSKREKKSRSTAEFPSRFDSLPLNGVAPVVGNVTTPSTPRPTLSASADSVSSSPLSAALSYVPTPIQIQTPNLQTVPNPVPVGLVGQPTSGSASPTSTFVDNPLPVTLSTPAVTAYPIAAPDAIPPPPPTNLPPTDPLIEAAWKPSISFPPTSITDPHNPPSTTSPSLASILHQVVPPPPNTPPPPQTLSASMAPSQGSSMAYRSPSQGFAFLAPSMTPAAAFTGEKRAGDGANGNA